MQSCIFTHQPISLFGGHPKDRPAAVANKLEREERREERIERVRVRERREERRRER